MWDALHETFQTIKIIHVSENLSSGLEFKSKNCWPMMPVGYEIYWPYKNSTGPTKILLAHNPVSVWYDVTESYCEISILQYLHFVYTSGIALTRASITQAPAFSRGLGLVPAKFVHYSLYFILDDSNNRQLENSSTWSSPSSTIYSLFTPKNSSIKVKLKIFFRTFIFGKIAYSYKTILTLGWTWLISTVEFQQTISVGLQQTISVGLQSTQRSLIQLVLLQSVPFRDFNNKR